MPRSTPCIVLLSVGLLLGACREPKVTSYQVPKEQEATMPSTKATTTPSSPAATTVTPPAAAPATPPAATTPPPSGGNTMASTPVATAAGPGLTWTAPSHWQSKPAGAMRKATYAIPGDGGATAELSITAFPGEVGGEVANVNRWRSQIQLPPLSPAETTAAITRLEHNGLKMGVVDLANTTTGTATRVLGAMVPHAGSTWFFKLTGPDALVAKEKPAFFEYLKTIKPGA